MENGRRHQTGLRRFPHLLLFRWVWGGLCRLIVSWGEFSAMLIVTSAENSVQPLVKCGECSAVWLCGKAENTSVPPHYWCPPCVHVHCTCCGCHDGVRGPLRGTHQHKLGLLVSSTAEVTGECDSASLLTELSQM